MYWDTLPQGVWVCWVGGSTETVLVHPELLWCTGILYHRGYGCAGWVVVLGQSWYIVHPELLWCTRILCHRGYGCAGWVVVLGQSWHVPNYCGICHIGYGCVGLVVVGYTCSTLYQDHPGNVTVSWDKKDRRLNMAPLDIPLFGHITDSVGSLK